MSQFLIMDVGGDGLRQLHSRRTAGGSQEGYGTGAILPERGIYLIAAVYRPILQVLSLTNYV